MWRLRPWKIRAFAFYSHYIEIKTLFKIEKCIEEVNGTLFFNPHCDYLFNSHIGTIKKWNNQ